MSKGIMSVGRCGDAADPLWPRDWFRFFLLPLTWMFVRDPRRVSQYPDPSWAIVAWGLLLGAEIAAVPVGLVWYLGPKVLFRLYFSVERLPSVGFAETVASGRADGLLALALAVVFILLRFGALAYFGRRERNRPATHTGDEVREHRFLGWSLWFLCLPVLSLFFQGKEPFEDAAAATRTFTWSLGRP